MSQPGATFGGVLLPSANLDVVSYITRYHNFGQVLLANLFQSLPLQCRNFGMVERPFPVGSELDTLYWPSGAPRFSYAHHLVSDRLLNAIRTNTASATDWISQTYTIGDDLNQISTPMYMLPPKPISQGTGPLGPIGGSGTISSSGASVLGNGTTFMSDVLAGDLIGNAQEGFYAILTVNSDVSLTLTATPTNPFNDEFYGYVNDPTTANPAYNNLWLCTFVDQRYLWWFKAGTYSSFVEGSTTWQSLYIYIFEQVIGLSSGQYALDSIDSAYGKPSGRMAFNYQPIPIVLDTIASTLGQRIFVDYATGKVQVQNYSTSKTIYLSNLAAYQVKRVYGGDYYTTQSSGSTVSSVDLVSAYPRYTVAMFPGVQSSGAIDDWVGYEVQGQYNTGHGGDYTADATGGQVNLGFNGQRVIYADLDLILNVTGGITNVSAVSACAATLAAAENNWYLRGSDYTLGGIKPWAAEGISDRIDFHMESLYDAQGVAEPYAIGTTRIYRQSFYQAEARGLQTSSTSTPTCSAQSITVVTNVCPTITTISSQDYVTALNVEYTTFVETIVDGCPVWTPDTPVCVTNPAGCCGDSITVTFLGSVTGCSGSGCGANPLGPYSVPNNGMLAILASTSNTIAPCVTSSGGSGNPILQEGSASGSIDVGAWAQTNSSGSTQNITVSGPQFMAVYLVTGLADKLVASGGISSGGGTTGAVTLGPMNNSLLTHPGAIFSAFVVSTPVITGLVWEPPYHDGGADNTACPTLLFTAGYGFVPSFPPGIQSKIVGLTQTLWVGVQMELH